MATVLVVSGQTNHRMLCRIELEDAGYRVVELNDIQHVPIALEQAPPDLLVFDPPIQEASWLPVLQAIKKMNPNLPVVIYTCYSLFGCALQYRDIINAWVLKSSNIENLVQAVSYVLKTDVLDKPSL